MNKYIRKSLEPGEEIVFNGRLHWSYIWGYIFWEWLLLIGAIALAIYNYRCEQSEHWLYYCALVLLVLAFVVWIIGKIVRTYSEFVVTATRFIQKDGFFSIHMKEIPLFKIETVNFHQRFIQRIIGTGGIELVGSGGTYHLIEHIDKPMDVRKAIVSAINKSGVRNAEDVPGGPAAHTINGSTITSSVVQPSSPEAAQSDGTSSATYEQAESSWSPGSPDISSSSTVEEDE